MALEFACIAVSIVAFFHFGVFVCGFAQKPRLRIFVTEFGCIKFSSGSSYCGLFRKIRKKKCKRLNGTFSVSVDSMLSFKLFLWCETEIIRHMTCYNKVPGECASAGKCIKKLVSHTTHTVRWCGKSRRKNLEPRAGGEQGRVAGG